jgi:hypothetical protein
MHVSPNNASGTLFAQRFHKGAKIDLFEQIIFSRELQ